MPDSAAESHRAGAQQAEVRQAETQHAETRQTVVFVVGRPASGKTTVSRVIAERWRLPVVAKDGLKEILFETLGSGDRQWSETLGRASFALLDYVIERQLHSGASFLVDAAYNPVFENRKLRDWQHEYGFAAVQVHCTASSDELVRRYVQRQADGSRHPGHADHERLSGYRESLGDGRPEVLDLSGPVLSYDTEAPGGLTRLIEQLAAALPDRPYS